MKNSHYYAYVALAIINVALGGFNQQLGAGAVPLPASLLWIVPILSAGLVALGLLLPRVGQKASDQICTWHYWAYGGLIVLGALLGAFNQQLGAGRIPIAAMWQWTVPILSLVIVACTAFLPKAVSQP